MAVLAIERISVEGERLEALVRVRDASLMRTSAVPGITGRLIAVLPGITRHTCENGSAHGIVAEMADTETPHLLEHVAFELMALSGSPRTLRGETTWDFAADGRGVFRVRLGYDDDLVALGALKAGAGIVEWLLLPAEEAESAPRPDVAAIVAGLEALRARARG